MKQADKDRLVENLDTAIDCIEQLDDRSPISADDLRELRHFLLFPEDTDDAD